MKWEGRRRWRNGWSSASLNLLRRLQKRMKSYQKRLRSLSSVKHRVQFTLHQQKGIRDHSRIGKTLTGPSLASMRGRVRSTWPSITTVPRLNWKLDRSLKFPRSQLLPLLRKSSMTVHSWRCLSLTSEISWQLPLLVPSQQRSLEDTAWDPRDSATQRTLSQMRLIVLDLVDQVQWKPHASSQRWKTQSSKFQTSSTRHMRTQYWQSLKSDEICSATSDQSLDRHQSKSSRTLSSQWLIRIEDETSATFSTLISTSINFSKGCHNPWSKRHAIFESSTKRDPGTVASTNSSKATGTHI